MAAITASQMRKIHVLARDYGLDNDLLHIHVQNITGKDSLKKLTVADAVKVIESLEDRTKGGATEKQKRYIVCLAKELGWVDQQGNLDRHRLDGFCSKRFGVDHYKWLAKDEASKVIEGLKNMILNKEDEEHDGVY